MKDAAAPTCMAENAAYLLSEEPGARMGASSSYADVQAVSMSSPSSGSMDVAAGNSFDGIEGEAAGAGAETPAPANEAPVDPVSLTTEPAPAVDTEPEKPVEAATDYLDISSSTAQLQSDLAFAAAAGFEISASGGLEL